MAKYRHVGNVYKKEPEPWGAVIAIVIILIIIGAAIG